MSLETIAKMASDDADVTYSGRLFQIRGAATGKARSPTVDSRVGISDDPEAWCKLQVWCVDSVCVSILSESAYVCLGLGISHWPK